MREVIDRVLRARLKSERKLARRGCFVVDFARNPPEALTERPVERHAPTQDSADCAIIEVHDGVEGRTTVVVHSRAHRGEGPVGRGSARRVPTSAELHIPERVLREPRAVTEAHACRAHCELQKIDNKPLSAFATALRPFFNIRWTAESASRTVRRFSALDKASALHRFNGSALVTTVSRAKATMAKRDR